MSEAAHGERAALRAALAALDAAAETIREVLAASGPASRPELARAGCKRWPPRSDEIDLNDGTWLRGFKEAALIARMSEAHLRRIRSKIGVKIGGRWWIKIDRLTDPSI